MLRTNSNPVRLSPMTGLPVKRSRPAMVLMSTQCLASMPMTMMPLTSIRRQMQQLSSEFVSVGKAHSSAKQTANNREIDVGVGETCQAKLTAACPITLWLMSIGCGNSRDSSDMAFASFSAHLCAFFCACASKASFVAEIRTCASKYYNIFVWKFVFFLRIQRDQPHTNLSTNRTHTARNVRPNSVQIRRQVEYKVDVIAIGRPVHRHILDNIVDGAHGVRKHVQCGLINVQLGVLFERLELRQKDR